jgi:hypothetical protein
MKPTIIAIDFDGTCVTHEYPTIGEDIGAQEVLKDLINCKLILYTMRSGKELKDAVNWFNKNNIELWGINENPEQKSWTTSPKIYAHIYIDDAALGCPLIYLNEIGKRPYVDWQAIREMLTQRGLIKNVAI